MSWYKRFQMFFRVIAVLLILLGLFAYLSYSTSHVQSRSAELRADSFSVGTDYSGIVAKQYVQVGQHVTTGQQLFDIKSSTLATDIAKGQLNPSEAGLTLNGDGDLILKATASGVINSINYQEGGYVPGNSKIASITKTGSTYVVAKYILAAPDYSLLNVGTTMKVTLPNGQTFPASVYDISVESDGNIVYTVVQAKLQGVSEDLRFAPGTPVSTQLNLQGKTIFDTLKQKVQDLFKPRS